MKTLRSWRRGVFFASAIVLLRFGSLPAQQPAELTSQEKQALEHLRSDWKKTYRTTSLPVAARALNIKLSDESRLRLARHLDSHRSDFVAPARHGVTTVALSPEEKRIARALLSREIRHGSASTVAEAAADLKLPAPAAGRRLEFLRQLGVVSAEGEGPSRRYRAAERFPRGPSPRIDFYSHHVEVNGRERFEVA